MIRRPVKFLWQFMMLFILSSPLLSFAQSVALNNLSYSPQNRSWNLNFNTTAPVQIHYFLLKNPNRLVIEMNDVNAFYNQLNSKMMASSPVDKIRSAIQPGHQMRIVLDLKQVVQVKQLNSTTFVLKTESQTVSDLKISSVTIPAVENLRPIVVVIDPGHGGKDPGAIGYQKIKEKDVVLNIAHTLQAQINQQPGFKALLTRNGDYYLTLRERLDFARKNKADMFIAIHADAYSNHTAHGVSVFALSNRGATSEAARWLAAKENQSELMGGVGLPDKENLLRSVLINLSQNATIQASLMIGKNLLDNIQSFAHLHHPRMEQAAFVVLKSPDIPSLLVETGFISNSREEDKLSNQTYQLSLAKAMMLGIKQYFIQRPPPGTWLASQDSRYKYPQKKRNIRENA